MQPLPADFLADLAKRYELSPEQTEALIKRLGDKDNEQMDAEALHISLSALSSRMTGVYTKFRIGSGGAGKLRKLHDFLLDEYRKTAPIGVEPTEPETDIDALVQTVRAQVYGDIQARCGTMRVLDMEQPISLGDIYTSVNILEKLSSRRRLGLDELLQDCDLENFDRFLLGQVRHKRVPGLEAVERHNQLMILGKPGAGKTTFMKRLAILCNQGEFQPERVPIFVTLKDYAEAAGKSTLHEYIQTQWQACGVAVPMPTLAERSRSQNLPATKNDILDALVTILGKGKALVPWLGLSAATLFGLATILGKGKALVLLDGLDEVSKNDHDRVLRNIKTFAHQFRTCQCVITCRIAAREYTFEQFTDVEVADFDQEQIAEFATKWFVAKQDPQKAKTFIQRLEDKDNKPLRELAITPILLTLLCLIFEETSKFPNKRSDLYREGIDLLLKKWDEKRKVKRDLVYKKLSIECKNELLSQLAFTTFERGDYFFKQSTVEQHIIQYICKLLAVSDDNKALQLDGESVLKSIEAQHGLLVERAKAIYSFSHLTFQEYFTAQHIISTTKTLNQVLQELASHITEKRYREIFLLTASMLPEADFLLLLIKQQIDLLMVDDPTKEPKLQIFLAWIQQKATSVNALYKLVAIRAFYYALNYALDLTRDCALDRILDDDLDRALALHRGLDLDRTLALDRALDLALACAQALHLARALDRDLDLDQDLDLDLDLDLNLAEQSAANDPELKLMIQALRAELPNRDDQETFDQWWLVNGKTWAEQLRAVMIEYRNIGYNWQFSKTQEKKLHQYYDANKLLVDCLNSDCYVTKTTRQYIEDTLLLPLSEIEKYPVPDAIANL